MDITMIGLLVGLAIAVLLFCWLYTRPFYPEREEDREEYPWKEWEQE